MTVPLGSRAELAKSRFAAAEANAMNDKAKNLPVIWTAKFRCMVAFICSLYSMKLVMRRQRRFSRSQKKDPVGRVAKLGRGFGLAASFSPQLRPNLGVP